MLALVKYGTGSLWAVAGVATASAAMVAYRMVSSRERPHVADVKAPAQTCGPHHKTSVACAPIVYVGLARVRVGTTVRGHVENDVILEMALREVAETLFIFVDDTGVDACASVHYANTLYAITWDLMCVLHKQQVDVTIVVGSTAPHAWHDIFGRPDLGAMYGYHDATPQTTKWLLRDGLLPVAYRSPASELLEYFTASIRYVDIDTLSVTRHAVVLVNGTFDHLHNGHRKLLALAMSICSERLVVGITAAAAVLESKPFAKYIQPLAVRKANVCAFVHSLNPTLQVDFQDVVDQWGPVATWTDIRTIVVTATSDIAARKRFRLNHDRCALSGLLTLVVRRTDRSTLSSRWIRARLAAQGAKSEM